MLLQTFTDYLVSWAARESINLRDLHRKVAEHAKTPYPVIFRIPDGIVCDTRLLIPSLDTQLYRACYVYLTAKDSLDHKIQFLTAFAKDKLLGPTVDQQIWDQLPEQLRIHCLPGVRSTDPIPPEVQTVIDILHRQPVLDLIGAY